MQKIQYSLKAAAISGIAIMVCLPSLVHAAVVPSWEDVQTPTLPSQGNTDESQPITFNLSLPSFITPAKLRDKDEGTLHITNAVLDPAKGNKLYFAVNMINRKDNDIIETTNKIYSFDRTTNKLQRIYREFFKEQQEYALELDFVTSNKLVVHYQVGDYSPNGCESNFYQNEIYGHSFLDTRRPWTGLKKWTYSKSIIDRNAQEISEMCKNI